MTVFLGETLFVLFGGGDSAMTVMSIKNSNDHLNLKKNKALIRTWKLQQLIVT